MNIMTQWCHLPWTDFFKGRIRYSAMFGIRQIRGWSTPCHVFIQQKTDKNSEPAFLNTFFINQKTTVTQFLKSCSSTKAHCLGVAQWKNWRIKIPLNSLLLIAKSRNLSPYPAASQQRQRQQRDQAKRRRLPAEAAPAQLHEEICIFIAKTMKKTHFWWENQQDWWVYSRNHLYMSNSFVAFFPADSNI